MKKVCLIVIILALSLINNAIGQSISEENYIKEENNLWENYEKRVNEIMALRDSHPEKRDSLFSVYQSVLDSAQMKNVELAIKYSSTPSGLERVFMCRADIPKEKLRDIISRLPDSISLSDYAKQIQLHIETKQIAIGDKYYEFQAKDSDGNDFSMSLLDGKTTLLIYGGLDCMGEQGRELLAEVYKNKNSEFFKIVIFYPVKDIDALRSIKEHFNVEYIFISDFLGDFTPFKVLYGAQGTPTCITIDPKGIIIGKTFGFSPKDLNIE